MIKRNSSLLCIILLILTTFTGANICLANAAEPPSIIIIVPNAPQDLEISIDNMQASRTEKAFESYFSFYSYSFQAVEYTLTVTDGSDVFEIELDSPLKEYNNIYTLDLDKRVLSEGESPSRDILLITIRIALTLLLEALVFFLFGYRQKISWIIFLTVNLVTQGVLFIWLNSLYTSPLSGDFYIILTMIFAEILIFIVEMTVFLIFIKEHRRLRTAGYVVVANLLSLILGGYLITVLPI
ncbi:MAG TPA: hypothetical protein DCR71_04335 [Dehalococcoidia bacterium]|nr:hypothetical protein [Dehalococcoidia bacterium]HAS27638.1 hypothetical protein [Dehalococcoidia bacterium]